MRTPTTDRPHDGVNTIYTQHELTASEIRRDRGRQAAIDHNRGRSARRDSAEIFIKNPDAPATQPQVEYVSGLLAELEKTAPSVYAIAMPWCLQNVPGMTMGRISDVIDRLKKHCAEAGMRAPQRPNPETTSALAPQAGSIMGSIRVSATPAYHTPAPPANRDRFTDVPDGYYAVTTNDDVLAFYRVSTWKDGGRKVQVYASDTLHLVRGHKATDAILAKVREITPLTAGKLFAQEIGKCYKCGRMLTNETSRTRGTGDDCASKQS